MISSQAFQKLAEALTPEVIDYIHEDERYVLFMQEIIPDALVSKLGHFDEELKYELALCIMDRIYLKQLVK